MKLILYTLFILINFNLSANAETASHPENLNSKENVTRHVFTGSDQHSEFFGPSCRQAKNRALINAIKSGYLEQDCKFLKLRAFSACEIVGYGTTATAYLVCTEPSR